MDFLKCVRCKLKKTEAEFDVANKATGRRQNFCQGCRKLYQKESYERTKERKIARSMARAGTHRSEMKLFIRGLKKDPCSDCGNKYHWFAMDFDHREASEKVDDISRMIQRGSSKETLLEEIAKCDLVCATCHRLRTARRLGLRADNPL